MYTGAAAVVVAGQVSRVFFSALLRRFDMVAHY